MYHYSRYLVGILAPKVYTILVLGPFGKHSCPTPAILNKMSLSWAAPKPFRAPLRVPLRAPLKEHTEHVVEGASSTSEAEDEFR